MTELSLLADVFEAIPVPAYVVDADLRIVVTNRALRERSVADGIDADHLVGKSILEAFPFLPSNIVEEYRQVLGTGEMAFGQAVFEINRRAVYFEDSRFPIFQQGRVSHVGIVFRDITELKETQEALRNSEETARALMNASTESMFLISEDETIAAANATGAERLGMSVRELEGKSAEQALGVWPKKVRERRTDYYREVKKTGKPVRFTDERMGRIFDISMCPVTDATGVSRRVAVFAHDVTEFQTTLKALGESEKRFRDLFEHLPVPTYVWQSNGDALALRRANKAAEQITQGKIGEYLGTTAEHMYGDSHPQILSDLQTCFSTREPIVREMRYRLKSNNRDTFLEVHYAFVPPDEVLVHTVDLTQRRNAELALQDSYDNLEQKVAERTRELAAANEQLRVERESLNQKNAAMRELAAQINDSKTTLASSIRTNLQRVTYPILERLTTQLDEPGRNYLKMLRESLDDILSPHFADLQKHHPYLTAHEIDLCNLIKSGFTCKEIARMRGRSEQTILKQRKQIRKKLGLTDEKVNLRNYLASVVLKGNSR